MVVDYWDLSFSVGFSIVDSIHTCSPLATILCPLEHVSGYLIFSKLLMAHTLASPCLCREPKARVVTHPNILFHQTTKTKWQYLLHHDVVVMGL